MHTDSKSVTLGSFLAERTLLDFPEKMAMNEDEADFRGRGINRAPISKANRIKKSFHGRICALSMVENHAALIS